MNYEKWLSSAPLEYKKKLIAQFIQKTREYAEDHVALRITEIQNADRIETEQKINRISKWFAYVEFQEHTLKELQSENIDKFVP